MNSLFPEYFKNGEDFIKQYIPSNGNNVFNYFMTDSEELFNTNLKTQPEDWKYRTKDVKYSINSLGYRTLEFDDIDWKNSIVMFGCSTTFGVGVSDDETLPYYLGKLFNRDVINMGVVGCSNQFLLDSSLVLKKKYGIPYGIIFMWTITSRFPYYNFEKVKHVGVWDIIDNSDNSLESKKYSDIFKNLYSETSHELITNYNIIESTRNIWSDKTIFHDGSYFYDTTLCTQLERYTQLGCARDLMHPDEVDHFDTANKIYNKIK